MYLLHCYFIRDYFDDESQFSNNNILPSHTGVLIKRPTLYVSDH